MAMLKYFKFPFATSGDKAAIPDTVQPGGEVSYPQGFGPDYELDPGGFPSAKDVPRDETNQLYFDITNALKEYQEFGTPDFIDSAMNGGSPFSYAKFARVKWTDGKVYVSKKDLNTSLPSVVADWYQESQDAEFLSIATTDFEVSVTDGEVVYWDSANNRFDEAVADGTTKQNVIGIADVTNGRVYLYGLMVGKLSGLTPNTEYYLSPSTPGAVTSAKPSTNAIRVGTSKNATDLFVAPVPASVAADIVVPNGFMNGKCWIDQEANFTAVNLSTTRAFAGDGWSFKTDAAPSGTITAQCQINIDGDTPGSIVLKRSAGSYVANITGFIHTIPTDEAKQYMGRKAIVTFRAKKGATSKHVAFVPRMITGSGVDQGTNSALAGTWTGTLTQDMTQVGALSLSTVEQEFTYEVDIPDGTREMCFYINNNGYTGTGDATDFVEIGDFTIRPEGFPMYDATYVEDLARCKSQWRKSYLQSSLPGAADQSQCLTMGTYVANETNHFYLNADFEEMRANPTIAWYPSTGGAAGNIRNVTGGVNVAVSATTRSGPHQTGYPSTAAIAAISTLEAHYTANARL